MNFDLNQEPQGFFVRDKEGHFYFLPTDEAKRIAVHSNDASMVRKLWDSADCGEERVKARRLDTWTSHARI